MKEFIIKRKGILIVALIAIVVIVLSSIKIYLPQEGKETEETEQTTQKETAEYVFQGSFLLPVGIENQVDESSSQTKKAIETKKKLESSLPIYVENFKTSNDRLTTLNVYTIPEDSEYLIHIEIYGIDYQIQNSNPSENPDAVAFIDSFNEIKNRLSSKGVNVKDLYFVFSGRDYIQDTAEIWIKEFQLLK